LRQSFTIKTRDVEHAGSANVPIYVQVSTDGNTWFAPDNNDKYEIGFPNIASVAKVFASKFSPPLGRNTEVTKDYFLAENVAYARFIANGDDGYMVEHFKYNGNEVQDVDTSVTTDHLGWSGNNDAATTNSNDHPAREFALPVSDWNELHDYSTYTLTDGNLRNVDASNILDGALLFDRTLCGSIWDTPRTTGCCPPTKYMSNPTLDPFLEANACSNCPSGKSTCQENAGDVSFCTKSCTYEELPDCTGDSADRSGGLQKIIDDWMAGGATQTAVVAKYGSIEDWDVTDVKHFRYAFHATGNDGTFTADISKWDVSNAYDFTGMFSGQVNFNSDVTNWDTSSAIYMDEMFKSATSFNRDLSKWKTSKVTTMKEMFAQATSFNQDLSQLDVSQVLQVAGMFQGATAFNSDLSLWEVNAAFTSGSQFDTMFDGATSFTQSLCGTQWSLANQCAACPTDLKYKDDASLAESNGWNLWSSSCRLENTIVVPLGKTLKIKQDTTGQAGVIVVDRQGSSASNGKHFEVQGNLVVERLHLQGGYDNGNAGSVYIDAFGDATFRRCTLSKNYAGENGGAVYVDGGKVLFDKCLLHMNGASLDGGAVFVDQLQNTKVAARFEECTLSKNHAGQFGGAVFSSGAVTLNECTTTSNTATSAGAAFYAHFSSATKSFSIINPELTSQTDVVGGSSDNIVVAITKKIKVCGL
jgi:surface protein/predicted outer membrane repeat protein